MMTDLFTGGHDDDYERYLKALVIMRVLMLLIDPTPVRPWHRCQVVREHQWPVGTARRSWSICSRWRWHRGYHHEHIVKWAEADAA